MDLLLAFPNPVDSSESFIMTKNVSPSKKIRSLKRLFTFVLRMKKPTKLAITNLHIIDIPPVVKILTTKSMQTSHFQAENTSSFRITNITRVSDPHMNYIPQLDGSNCNTLHEPPKKISLPISVLNL